MAIENKRMQQRFGTYNEFQKNKSNLLPNEFASVVQGSPDTKDGSALFFRFGTNEPKLIVDEDKLQMELQKLKNELAVGDGSISGQGVLVMQGAISNSIAGKGEYNEQKQSD